MSYLPRCSTSYNMNQAICQPVPPRACCSTANTPPRHFSPVNTFCHGLPLPTYLPACSLVFELKHRFGKVCDSSHFLANAMCPINGVTQNSVMYLMKGSITHCRGGGGSPVWNEFPGFPLFCKPLLANHSSNYHLIALAKYNPTSYRGGGRVEG